jgi:uncharacterized membrane protein YhaH (DUF805 family)
MEAVEKWFLNILKNKYADFEGRAQRQEFWMFYLFSFIIFVVLEVLALVAVSISNILAVLFGGLLFLVALGLLVPNLAIGVRRLHDIGKSGWFYLVSLIPLVGGIILLIFFCLDSQSGDNQYGPNPKGQ